MEAYRNLSRSPRLPHKRLAAALRLLIVSAIATALLFGLARVEHPWDTYEYLFIIITLLTLLAEFYWLAGPYINTKSWHPSQPHEIGIELFTPSNFLYVQRHKIRVALQSLLIVSSLVITLHLSNAGPVINALFALGYFIFALIFLEWLTVEAIRNLGMGPKWGWWLVTSAAIGCVVGIAFYKIRADLLLSLLSGSLGAGITLVIYLTKRVDVGEYVWSQVIGELIVQVLNSPHSQQDFDHVVGQIASRLGYEHVSLLEVSNDKRFLNIVAEYGAFRSVKGKALSIPEGINGRAYLSGQTCAWNDVEYCPYYKGLLDRTHDHTRAEIAVPIKHRGQVLGILDVQSSSALVFGPGDIRTLEVIAHILGNAWAAAATDRLIEQGTQLWDQLSSEIHSEDDVFEVFAEFAQKNMGADLVVYYRLSPTGYPFRAPQVVGQLNYPERMNSPVYNLDSPLYELIRRWRPVYEEQVQRGGIFLHNPTPDHPSFAKREEIESSFFIPIGPPDERMAVVFLNYRCSKVFDGLFQLVVLGFAQAFATTLAREGYREQLFHGLARPELGVHNILGRYGMKDGVSQEGSKIFEGFDQKQGASTRQSMLKLLGDVDNCLIEIRAQTAKVSLNWESSLRERIEDMTRKIKEHVPSTRTVRFVKKIDPLVERESPWTRLALYRVTEEAVNNAIFHGDASEITICVERAENSIVLSIQNNGIPLPLDAEEKHSRSGIFEILDEIKQRFLAQVQINRIEHGTIVKVQIPALPINPKERQS